jgi:hypothetical protein
MIVSTFQGFPNPLRFKPIHQYLQSLFLKSIDKRYGGEHLTEQLRILTYDQQHNHANEAGYTHFLGAWHDSFQQIKRTNGVYAAVPGAPYQHEMRQTVLYTQKQIWDFVKSGQCAVQVNEWARSFGFVMPTARPRRVDANPEKLVEYRSKLSRRTGWADGLENGVFNLAQVLMTEPIAPRNHPYVVQAFSHQVANLEGFDWYAKARPKTALSDIQYLQKALGNDCEQLLKADQ